jgi:hypothetical protein
MSNEWTPTAEWLHEYASGHKGFDEELCARLHACASQLLKLSASLICDRCGKPTPSDHMHSDHCYGCAWKEFTAEALQAQAKWHEQNKALEGRLDRGRMLAASWTDCPFTTMDQGTMKTCGEEMLRVLGEKWIAESNPRSLELLREIEFFLRGHPGEASVLRAKVKALIDGAVERQATETFVTCPHCKVRFSGVGGFSESFNAHIRECVVIQRDERKLLGSE